MQFGTWEIVTITLVVIALITCIILFYFLVVCYVKMQATQREVIRWRDAEIGRVPTLTPPSYILTNRNRNTMHAVSNDYLPHPTQRAPQRHTLSNTNFGPGFDVPVMRFYTAEELLNFPFGEHQRELAELIAAAELSRASRDPQDDPRFSYHPHRSMPPASTMENISRRLSMRRDAGSNRSMYRVSPTDSGGEVANSTTTGSSMTLPNISRSIHIPPYRTLSAEPALADIPETKEENETLVSLDSVNSSFTSSPPPYEQVMAPLLESELRTA